MQPAQQTTHPLRQVQLYVPGPVLVQSACASQGEGDALQGSVGVHVMPSPVYLRVVQ